MKDEYIVVNKTKLKQRIAELKKINSSMCQNAINSNISNHLAEILTKSAPLEPIVSDAYIKGLEDYCASPDNINTFLKGDDKTKYINNLKLDI